jgi:hypothetical protein
MDNYTKMNREINDLAKKLSKIDNTEAREKLTFKGKGHYRNSRYWNDVEMTPAQEDAWLRSAGF